MIAALPEVRLRPLAETDIKSIDLWLWEGWADGFFLGKKPLREAGANLYALSCLTDDLYFAICDSAGEFLGIVGVKDREKGRGEFFISLLRKAQGRGFALAAGRRFLRLLFTAYPEMESIHMFTFADNRPTCCFNQRMGFLPEKDTGETVGGRPIRRFFLTKEDFLAQQDGIK